MARVHLVQDGDTDAFEVFKDLGHPPSDIFRALANVPSLMMAHTALPQALCKAEHCPPNLRELGVLRVSQLVGSPYEWSHHRPMALAAGVTEDEAAALAAWRESPLFRPVERLVIAATEATHDMTMTDAMFAELTAELGQAGAMELIVVVSQYEAVARIIHALGIEVDQDHQSHLADWTPA